LKDQAGTSLDTDGTAPTEGARFEILIDSTGIKVYLDETLILTSNDTDRIDNTTFVLAVTGNPTIAVHPDEGAFAVQR
jgi:hypothetical protein